MLDKFWESIGEGLGGQWVTALLQPALAFWAIGLLAWVERHTWSDLAAKWNQLGNDQERVAVLAGALLVLLASTAMMQWVQGRLLRWMEGYWPLRRLRLWRTERVRKQLAEKKERWQALADPKLQPQRALQQLEYIKLDREVVLFHPPQEEALLPTALGNRLRAAEEYANARYGLNTMVVWPRLWPLLPEGQQGAVSSAFTTLAAAVRLFGWGVLSMLVWGVFPPVLWGGWVWWTPLAGLAIAVAAWLRALNAAEIYGDLIRAAFDLHRFALYQSLHWPLPPDSATEREYGEQVTGYLFRGLVREPVKFAHTQEK